ncbi:MAG: helix-turn-helix domain-containing protein [Sciscionella sp.]
MPGYPTEYTSSVPINAELMQHLRKLSGLNQARFAQVCKVSAPYISHIERGRRKTISPAVYVRICNALGVKNREQLLLRDAA